MVNEREQLLAALAYRYEQDEPRQQPMEERRAYLAERLAIVGMEQVALEAELAPVAPVRELTARRLFLVYSASR